MSEKYEMNLLQPHTQSQTSLAISWSVAGVVTFLCLVLALASTRFVQPFNALFQGLSVELPGPTRFLLATYSWLLPMFYFSLAVFAIIIQFSDRDFRTKRLATVRVFLAALVSVGFIVFILYLPLLTVASKLSDAR
ncbi:MAG TPA: hypothetical protein VN025_03105 [Candidatus Dormibacteraeota bacterium]|nr:hypothetical protein [Candidatus Dormibacteraeota bacterium]